MEPGQSRFEQTGWYQSTAAQVLLLHSTPPLTPTTINDAPNRRELCATSTGRLRLRRGNRQHTIVASSQLKLAPGHLMRPLQAGDRVVLLQGRHQPHGSHASQNELNHQHSMLSFDGKKRQPTYASMQHNVRRAQFRVAGHEQGSDRAHFHANSRNATQAPFCKYISNLFGKGEKVDEGN